MDIYEQRDAYRYFKLPWQVTHWIPIFFLLIFTLLIFTLPIHGTAFARERTRILFISAYHPGFPTFFQQIDGLKDSFSEKNILLDIEFMDTKRFPGSANREQFKERLSFKFAQIMPYDVIVVGDDNALIFALEQQPLLFKGKPIVFFGVNNFNLATRQNDNPQVTGVVESVSMDQTLEVMIRLHPSATRILALVDATPSAQGDLSTFYHQAPNFSPLTFSDLSLSELSWEAFGRALEDLDEKTPVLLLSAYVDKNNVHKEFHESLKFITTKFSGPIYHLWYHGMGKGILGGKVISHYKQGETAAGLVLEILNGTPVNQLKVIVNSPNQYIFDYKALKKHHLSPSMLPKESLLLNPPHSFYQDHKPLIWKVIFVFTVLLTALLHNGLNIKRLKQTQRKLKESEKQQRNLNKRFTLAKDSAGIGVWELDLATNTLTWDDWMYRLYGIEPSQFKNDYGTWKNSLHPTDMETTDQTVQRAIRDGKSFDTQFRIVRPDGKIRHIKAFGQVLTDETGLPVNITGVNFDITEQKQAETALIHSEQQRNTSQKMEAIGLLAGGIAHDFNNILFPIIGMAELLLEDLPASSQEYENAQAILTAGKRASEMVRQILDFSRQSDNKKIPVKLQLIVKEALKLCRATTPSSIEIAHEIQNRCGSVMANPTQVHQIAMNLITNAANAIGPSPGKISVTLKPTVLKAGDLANTSLEPGPYAILSICDTGRGMDQKLINKIFEPYFTTQENGRGTGLGLSVVYGIVKDHQGEIKVYSAPGKGSTFNVYLPLLETASEALDKAMGAPIKKGREKILLVDDEDQIVKLEKMMLERLGYEVTALSSSVDALKTFKKNPDSFDLLLTDMTMPGMTGYELSKAVINIKPGMPIIICTGFSEVLTKEQAEAIGVKGFLMKPVVTSEIAGMIRKVLDGAGDNRP